MQNILLLIGVAVQLIDGLFLKLAFNFKFVNRFNKSEVFIGGCYMVVF